MKKNLVLGLVLVLLFAFTGCSGGTTTTEPAVSTAAATAAPTESVAASAVPTESASATTAPTESAAEETKAVEESADASVEEEAGWTITVGGTVLSENDLSALELITQTVNKQTKDGSTKKHECVGYTVKSILELAKTAGSVAVTVVSEDGTEYELTADVIGLPTTMLTVEQDGEANELPRLAVEGGASDAWLKDVVELRLK